MCFSLLLFLGEGGTKRQIRAFSDLIKSDRRSKFLFYGIFFRSTGIHLMG
jgi:hypothetical protein